MSFIYNKKHGRSKRFINSSDDIDKLKARIKELESRDCIPQEDLDAAIVRAVERESKIYMDKIKELSLEISRLKNRR